MQVCGYEVFFGVPVQSVPQQYCCGVVMLCAAKFCKIDRLHESDSLSTHSALTHWDFQCNAAARGEVKPTIGKYSRLWTFAKRKIQAILVTTYCSLPSTRVHTCRIPTVGVLLAFCDIVSIPHI